MDDKPRIIKVQSANAGPIDELQKLLATMRGSEPSGAATVVEACSFYLKYLKDKEAV